MSERSHFYRVLGIPRPLQRPRIYGGNKMYDPQKDEKAQFAREVKEQHVYDGIFKGPLALDITFYFPVAGYVTKKKTSQLLQAPHSKRPDLSNLIKMVEDALNDHIYSDDSQICQINAKKCYAEVPRTEFTLTEL